MLQQIRENSQSIVAKVLVGLIAITFALFGVDSLVGLANAPQAPATVNGEEVTEAELYQAAQLQRRQLMARLGDNYNPSLIDDNLINNMALDNLVEQKVLLQAANEDGLVYSDAMIDQVIVSNPSFQVDGKFNRELFESTLRGSGLSPLSYRKLLAEENIIQQERAALALSTITLDDDVKQVLALDKQTRDLQYTIISPETFDVDQTVSDTDLQAAYDSAGSRLDIPDQVVLEYLVLDSANLIDDVQVKDSDIQSAYDSLVSKFEAQEERSVSHILLEISDSKTTEQALTEATALKARLEQGESFEALATEASDDIGSAAAGGALGVIGKGVFPGEFEDVMFSMQAGEVSSPVETEFGVHIIKVNSISQTAAPSFEEAKSDIVADLTAQAQQALYVEQLEQLSDISYSSGDLVEPSKALGLEIFTAEPISRAGGDNDVLQDSRVLQAAFSDELVQEQLNSDVFELSDSLATVVRVKEFLPQRKSELSEVKDQLVAEILAERTQEALEARASDIIAASKTNKALVTEGEVVETQDDVSRNEQVLPVEVVAAAFKLPHPDTAPSFGKVSLRDGSVAVLSVTKVNKGDVSDIVADDIRAVKSVLAQRESQLSYAAVVALLNEKADIERP